MKTATAMAFKSPCLLSNSSQSIAMLVMLMIAGDRANNLIRAGHCIMPK